MPRRAFNLCWSHTPFFFRNSYTFSLKKRVLSELDCNSSADEQVAKKHGLPPASVRIWRKNKKTLRRPLLTKIFAKDITVLEQAESLHFPRTMRTCSWTGSWKSVL